MSTVTGKYLTGTQEIRYPGLAGEIADGMSIEVSAKN